MPHGLPFPENWGSQRNVLGLYFFKNGWNVSLNIRIEIRGASIFWGSIPYKIGRESHWSCMVEPQETWQKVLGEGDGSLWEEWSSDEWLICLPSRSYQKKNSKALRHAPSTSRQAWWTGRPAWAKTPDCCPLWPPHPPHSRTFDFLPSLSGKDFFLGLECKPRFRPTGRDCLG